MERFKVVSESNSDITFTVKFPQLHYLNEFIRLKCAPDLLGNGLFPNVKEITETMAAFNAVRKYMGVESFADNKIILFDVGCGHAPRNAALFAHMTSWNCHAIDPVLRKKGKFLRTKRLSLHPCRIEDYAGAISGDTIIILAVHAHINLETALKKFNAPRMVVIAMPCCNRLEIKDCKPIKHYDDLGCLSPMREVKIFDLVRVPKKSPLHEVKVGDRFFTDEADYGLGTIVSFNEMEGKSQYDDNGCG